MNRYVITIAALPVLVLAIGFGLLTRAFYDPDGEIFFSYLPVVNYDIPIQVGQTNTFGWYLNTTRVIGEVYTVSGVPVSSVELEVNLYNPQNELIGTGWGTTIFTSTLPGQLNPFDIYISIDPNESYSSTEVLITGWDFGGGQIYFPLTVVISDTFVDPGGSGLIIDVVYRNDSAYTLVDIYSVAWVMEGDQYSSLFLEFVTPSLAPGATISYTHIVPMSGGPPDPQERVAAQGRVPP